MVEEVSLKRLPCEKHIFNYRFPRAASRVVQNAFSILVNRFQWLLATMRQEPETVKTIELASLRLNNLMRTRYPALQNALRKRDGPDHQMNPGAWRNKKVFQEVPSITGGNAVTRQGN